MVDFVIDNESLIARILTDLYHELPAQLRPQSDLVEASTILFEVLEYLTHVKKVRKIKNFVFSQAGDDVIFSRPYQSWRVKSVVQ